MNCRRCNTHFPHFRIKETIEIMFEANEKIEESGSYGVGTAEVKRFFQWILGCTYAKKTFRTRMAEMFHFADAPHIVVYERSEERPWYWMVGIIIAVLIAVLSLYYTLEAGFRAIRKLMYSVIREPPQSTVSTPRCLSPTTPSSNKTSPQTPKKPDAVRQKVAMNEPVNCVFIRPVVPKLAVEGTIPVPSLNSEEDVTVDADKVMTPNKSKEKEKKELSLKEKRDKRKSPPTMRLDEVKFDASSNFNIIPTMAPSPHVHSTTTPPSNRKSSGSDKPEAIPAESSTSENYQINEWVMQQIAGLNILKKEEKDEERADAGVAETIPMSFESVAEGGEVQCISHGFMETIQELIEAQLANNSVLEASSDENISQMSKITDSIITSLIEIESSFDETQVNSNSDNSTKPKRNILKDLIKRGDENEEEDADIIMDDSYMLSDSEDSCGGSILIRGNQQRVLFRWTDENPNKVESVTLTGSFLGWNINIPMKRNGVTTFQVSVDLPEGLHDYLINIYRFD